MKLINKPQIYYPDCDGKPMADNTKQFRLIVMIKENLEIFYAAFMNDVAPTNNGTKIILHHRLHLKSGVAELRDDGSRHRNILKLEVVN